MPTDSLARPAPDDLARQPYRDDLPVPVKEQAGLLDRVMGDVKGLVQDVRDYAELKARLTQLEIEEKVEGKINRAVDGAMVGVLAGVAGLFLLVAIALGVGELLGHPAWGFLVVAAVLGVVAFFVLRAKPHLVRIAPEKMTVKAGSYDGKAGDARKDIYLEQAEQQIAARPAPAPSKSLP